MRGRDEKPERNGIRWLSAADVMQHEVVSVQASDPIDEVERVIADAGVSGVPVLSDDGKVVGVLSTSDLVSRYANGDDPDGMPIGSVDEDGDDITLETRAPRGGEATASDIMTPGAETIAPDANLREVARRMVDSGVHRLLVVKNGRLEGIISTIDILRALAS